MVVANHYKTTMYIIRDVQSDVLRNIIIMICLDSKLILQTIFIALNKIIKIA